MKFFVCFALVIACATALPAGQLNNQQEAEGQEAQSAAAQQQAINNEQQFNGNFDLNRFRKAAYGAPAGGAAAAGGYGGASIQAPPCPKNYLFSCQPSLSPVPCAGGQAGGYGSAGAYSAPVPQYYPVSGTYNIPQTYEPSQGTGYLNNQKFSYYYQ